MVTSPTGWPPTSVIVPRTMAVLDTMLALMPVRLGDAALRLIAWVSLDRSEREKVIV